MLDKLPFTDEFLVQGPKKLTRLCQAHTQAWQDPGLTESASKDTTSHFRFGQFITYLYNKRKNALGCQLPVVLVPQIETENTETERADDCNVSCGIPSHRRANSRL